LLVPEINPPLVNSRQNKKMEEEEEEEEYSFVRPPPPQDQVLLPDVESILLHLHLDFFIRNSHPLTSVWRHIIMGNTSFPPS
jgi:hypothetical protein